MAIGGRRTVWILGAGFSRSLGAPLLASLFRQQVFGDVRVALADDLLAAHLVWSQAVFNLGKREHLWEDGEDFLSFVDAAFGDATDYDRSKRGELAGLFSRKTYLDVSHYHFGLDEPLIAQCVADPAKAVRRALALEASRFLRYSKNAELWKPYRAWAKSLDPALDSVVTFNYDTLLERLGRPFHAVLPPGLIEPESVPVFKLHGSADWATDDDAVERVSDAIDRNLTLAIAAPGRSKASLTDSLFKPIWNAAKVKLREAAEIVVIGYSFPKTDALARMTLLDSIADENCGVRIRRATLVLGPDVDFWGNRRVLELLWHRMGRGREITLNDLPSPVKMDHSIYRGAVINQHRLWAEDFIGDYHQRAGNHLP